MQIKSAIHEAAHAVCAIATGGRVISLSLAENETSCGRCRVMSAAGAEGPIACAAYVAMSQIGIYRLNGEEFHSDWRQLEKLFGLPRRKLFESRQFRRAVQRAEKQIKVHAVALDRIGLELARRTSISGGRVHQIFEESRTTSARTTNGAGHRIQAQSQSQLIGEAQGGRRPTWAGITPPSFA
ncbi:MAG: hypothetical protein VB835_08810 [Pirellulales bacterium]